MHDLAVISTLAGGLAAALVFGWLTQRIGLSTLVGYMLAGILVGPHTPGFVADPKLASQMAEIGVILLMFGVGLHFHLGDLIAVKNVAVPGAVGQTVGAAAVCVGVFAAFGMSVGVSAVIGVAVAVASTVVMMRVLMDADVLGSTAGHIAVGWSLVQDVLTVVVLVMIPVLGTDPLTDTAVIRADGVGGLTAATIGQSSQLDVGQEVVAIGSPFGLESTVTSGIVSALNRPVNVGTDAQGNATTYPAIQTDAAINPGNSGGPLVDMNGDVIGINASIRTATSTTSGQESGSIGLGFAIPIDEVMPIVDQMTQGETPTHAKMGVSVGDVTSGSTGTIAEGAVVRDVTAGSAAAKAGLQQGDVITKVDDHQIVSADSLVATIRSYRPGDTVTVTWEGDGKDETGKITLDSDSAS